MEATSRGYRINYVVQGQGEPLLLIPGLLQRLEDWRDAGYTAALASRFRVLAVDPLGHGASDTPREASAYLRDDAAADVLAVLDAEGIEAAHIWGYSRGASLAYRLGTLFPQRVRSLIAGGSNIVPGAVIVSSGASQALRDGDWDAFFLRLGLELRPETRARFARLNDADAIAASIEGGALSGPAVYDLSPLRGRILVYAGTREAWLASEEGRQRFLGGCSTAEARAELLDGLNHAEAFQAKDAVVALALDFLDAVSAQSV